MSDVILDDKEGLQIFSEILQGYSFEELDDFFEAMKEIRGKKMSFSYDNITVYNDYVVIDLEDKRCAIETPYAYLELERQRKNEVLKTCIGKTVKVVGVVSNVKLLSNAALFCLSPCIINDTDIGHTWTRYTPDFKNIKYGAVICFYSEIKTYGPFHSKSGVDWQEISYVRMENGDNSKFYNIPLNITGVRYAEVYDGPRDIPAYAAFEDEIIDIPDSLVYEPDGRATVSINNLVFKSYEGINITYNTYEGELVFNSKFCIEVGKETQSKLDALILFEWLAKLEEWEFWGYTRNKRPR